MSAKKNSIRRFWSYLWQMIQRYPAFGWQRLFLLITRVITTFIWSVYSPILFAKIVDILTDAADKQAALTLLWPKVTVYFGLSIGATILSKIGQHLGSYYGPHFAQVTRLYALEVLEQKSAQFYASNHVGAILNKANRLERAIWGLNDFVFTLLEVTVTMVGVLVALYLLLPSLTGWALLWIVAFTVLTSVYTWWKHRYDLVRAENSSKMNGFFADTIGNMMLVKAFAAEKPEYQQYEKVSGQYRDSGITAYQLGALQGTATSLLIQGANWGVFTYLIMQWGLDLLSVGYIIMVTRYFWAITGSLSNIGEQFNTASEHLSNAMEMLDIFDESIEVQDPPHPEPCRITGGSITFNGVDFTYEMEGKEVFQGLNLTVPAGQRVGIVGPSGSGKSTLMKLLLRFADPEKGTISIDGQDIARITQASLREHITYVPQDPMLFHRSLAENIRYGDPNASDEQLAEAARLAHASSFIDVLPEGYATLVGERGVKLSGGERQRVAIARAMLKQAPLLLLDEATSALDTQSERYIQDALETLMRGRTTVVVAHRLSTIMQMDRIIVMDKGQIVEDGPHEALLAAGGLYATLWEHQTDGFLAEDPQQS